MSTKYSITHMQDTTANWAASTYIIPNGEIVIERCLNGTSKFKVGNGRDTYANLSYTLDGQNVVDAHDTDNAAHSALFNEKVDKVDGKGLSTNDYNATEKANVASNTTARHTHSNSAILDTITETPVDITETQTFTDSEKQIARNNLDTAAIDGYYAQMAVGTADNLAGKGDGVSAIFTHRTTGGTADVADGTAAIKSIKGNTVVWNQLMSTIAGTQTINGVLFKNNGDGSWTVNGTATARTDKQLVGNLGKSGDKMLVVGCPAGGSGSTYLINEANTSVTLDTGEGKIVTRSSYGFIPCITIKEGYTANNLVFRPQVFDLTQMFGAGNEPSSVEEFKALFPNDYYEYDAGSLLSFNATGIKTVGFNAYNGTYTKVVKGEIGGGKNNGYEIVGTYTAIKFSETVDGARETLTVETAGDVSYIVPPSNGYVFIEGASSDTCLHLRWSGIRNGEYEDYWTQTRNLDLSNFDVTVGDTVFSGMKSAGAVYDEQTKDKDIHRIGVLDLTGLTWAFNTIYSNDTKSTFHSTNIEIPEYCRNILLNGFVSVNGRNSGNFVLGSVAVSGTKLFITVSPSITTTDAFITSLNSTNSRFMFYELATYVETLHEPVLNLSYQVSDFGTEEIVTADNAMTAPCNMEVVYGINAVDTIRRLPENYISKASFDAFCAALATSINCTITATWDATNGKYNYTITANG